MMIQEIFASALLLTTFYALIRPIAGAEISRRAWILTLCCSFCTTASGLIHLYRLVRGGWSAYLHAQYTLGHQTVIFFATFLVLDLLIGNFEYPSKLALLTGWIHHICYLGLLVYLLVHNETGPFCLFMVEEMPTFLFALGYIFKEFRSNYLFGGIYLVTRIIYHAYLTSHMYEYKAIGWQFAVTVLPVHCYWFYEWIMQQKRLNSLDFLSFFLQK